MATISEMQRRVKGIDLRKEAAIIVDDNKDKIVDKNRAQLEYTGTDSKGQKLRRYRSNSYAARKNRINGLPGFGTPDLFLTGSFQKKMTLKVNGQKDFDIFSTDSKNDELKAKYGEDIFGLQPIKKLQVKSEIMMPNLRKAVKNALKI